MVPRPAIARWTDNAPWFTFGQIEQDLIICRVLTTLFSDKFLQSTLAFRGGTALYKLYIKPAPRYSEDIDLVQIYPGPIKPILQQIGKLINFFKEVRTVQQKADNNTIIYRFTTEYPPIQKLRLKIEINCREHFTVLGYKHIPFEVKNSWYTGNANVTTYDIHELLGTKLRALYQRRKGRDLFDLYYAFQNLPINIDKVIKAYYAYMQFSTNKSPTKKQFIKNLETKIKDVNFNGDTKGILRTEIQYELNEAFTWIRDNVLKQLP